MRHKFKVVAEGNNTVSVVDVHTVTYGGATHGIWVNFYDEKGELVGHFKNVLGFYRVTLLK